MTTATPVRGPRLGGRVLLFDPAGRVLLMHARDPDNPAHHWWELPGGGLDPDEIPADACRRELAEETGIQLTEVGPCVCIRESRFHYRGRDHWRVDHIHTAHLPERYAVTATKHTDNERAGLLGRRWWTEQEIRQTTAEKFLPHRLGHLLPRFRQPSGHGEPLRLSE